MHRNYKLTSLSLVSNLKQSPMRNNHQALWDNCLQLIKANVTEQQFKTWFAPIVFENFSETTRELLVQVPSSYVYEYLEQYYVGLLSKVFARVIGPNVKLRYRIVTDKGHGFVRKWTVSSQLRLNVHSR